MDTCCEMTDTLDDNCPTCGEPGRTVGAAPVRAHHNTAVDGPWSFCPNARCHVVFFLGNDLVDDNAVITQVGTKATTKPLPVCFCFAHTADDIGNDLAANDGTSTIQAAVKAAVAAGLCACETLNPAGTCCLPQIHRIARSNEHR